LAHFGFFGTWDDTWRILVAILEHPEYCILPDSRYSDPIPFEGRTVDTVLQQLCAERGVAFIWSTSFSVQPPFMLRIDEGPNAGKYFLDLSRGGPGLALHLPGCYEKDNRVQLAPGALWYPKKTIDLQSKQWIPASTELKAGFRAVRNIIRRQLVEVKIGASSILTGSNAKRLIDANQADVHGIVL
jgi:hypothetical protein